MENTMFQQKKKYKKVTISILSQTNGNGTPKEIKFLSFYLIAKSNETKILFGFLII